ncbi:MAG: GntR family transcriptional regulator [Verrucomicrobia bacterium]|nr:GntR family transcriptional regulator [Verrucomicrobiota bacterium]
MIGRKIGDSAITKSFMTTKNPGPKRDSFAAALRADLLAGKFPPGTWLKQADLEAAYHAARFEVRIALAELTTQRLLDHVQNRGYRVADHTDVEREQLIETRILLETAACRLIVQRATDEQISEFQRLVEAFGGAIETDTSGRVMEINYQLHRCMYQMTGNSVLIEDIQGLRDRGVPGRTGVISPAYLRTSNSDHFEMLEMIKRRDGEGLAAVVYRHVNRWRKFSKPN